MLRPWSSILQSAVAVALLAVPPARGAPAEERMPEDDDRDEPVRTTLVEQVEVSATVAKERQDPASFSDLGRSAIEERHHGQDLGMLLGDTPNAYAYSDAGNGVGYSYLRLRGFDQTRIAVNINGVPLNTPESRQVYAIDLADFAEGLDLVQVQRGPGTALYGAPAVAGTINLETGHLSTTEGGRMTLGAGSFGTMRATLRYGGPLGAGRWAWMARVAHVRSDGYRDPSWTRHSLAHVALERFDEASIWRVHLFGGPEKTQLAYAGLPLDLLRTDRRANLLRPGETDTFVQPQVQVHNDRRLRPGLFLRNTWYAIYGDGWFRQYADRYVYDPAGFETGGLDDPEAFFASTWRKRRVTNRQVGWIPRVSWDHRGGTLTAGAEILLHAGRHRGTVTEALRCLGPAPDGDPGDPCGVTEPVAGQPRLYDYANRKATTTVFVRETLRASPRLAANLELQATRHRYAMRRDRVRDYSFDASYTFLTPRIGLNWNVTDAWNLFAQAATGRSEPVFSNVWNPQDTGIDPAVALFRSYDPERRRLSDPVARPERLRSLEVGVGFRRATSWLKLNAYRMAFRDEFVFAGGIDEDGVPITENAGRSLHAGVEVEGGVRLPGGVDISGYAAASRDVLRRHVLRSRLEDGTDAAIDYSGNRVALFPDHMVRLRVARSFGAARVEVGGRRVGTIYTDNSQDERKEPWRREGTPDAPYVPKKVAPSTVVDARVTLDLAGLFGRDRGTLTLATWIDNLLDARYETMGYSYPLDPEYGSFYTEFFPAASRTVFVSLSYGF